MLEKTMKLFSLEKSKKEKLIIFFQRNKNIKYKILKNNKKAKKQKQKQKSKSKKAKAKRAKVKKQK